MPAATQPTTTTTPTTSNESEMMDDKGAFTSPSSTTSTSHTGKAAASPPPAPPERVKVRVGNEEIETDPTSAAAINALLQNNQQMAELIRQGGVVKPAAPAAQKGYDYATGLFTEPEEAIKRLRAELREEIVGEVTAAYTQAESKKDFWASFYRENDQLKSEKLIVEAVTARDWAKLKDLPMDAAAKKIAEAAKREIMRLSGGKSESDPDSRPVEGGSSPKNPASSGKKGEDGEVTSLSDIIRARQAARHKATFHKE